MKKWQLVILAIVLVLISAVAGYQFQEYLNRNKSQQEVVLKQPQSAKDVIGTSIEDFSLLDVHGEQRFISEWQGKVMVINFWATWCAPCREEIPAFVELQQQYSHDGLQFIGIALQEAEEVRDFIVEYKMNYPTLVGSNEVIKAAVRLGNDIGAMPYTVVVDRNGVITFTRRGPLTKSETESVIKSLL